MLSGGFGCCSIQDLPDIPTSNVYRTWREQQATEIRKRDDEADARKEEIISRAEKQIDDFYRDYNAKKEKQIAKNKFV